MINVSVQSAPLSIINEQVFIYVGSQGAQGLPGVGIPIGGLTGQALVKASDDNYDTEWATIRSSNIVAEAGQTISALKLVYNDSETNTILYADKDLPASAYSLLGVTTQAGASGDDINVLTAGEMEDVVWNWDMDANVNLFLGANGAIVQGAPTGAVIVRIGFAVSSTKIMVRISDLIITA